MKRKIEIGPIERLNTSLTNEEKVVVVDEKLNGLRLLKIEVRGDETAVKSFYLNHCTECAVSNHTIELRHLQTEDDELLGMDCVIPFKDRRVRLCNLNGVMKGMVVNYEHFEVPEDNWFEVDPAIMNRMKEVAEVGEKSKKQIGEEMNMIYDKDLDMVVRQEDNEVSIIAEGKIVDSYWRTRCIDCKANPDLYAQFPDFVNEDYIVFVCSPKKGIRNCGLKTR